MTKKLKMDLQIKLAQSLNTDIYLESQYKDNGWLLLTTNFPRTLGTLFIKL